jgi:hypothetical protein
MSYENILELDFLDILFEVYETVSHYNKLLFEKQLPPNMYTHNPYLDDGIARFSAYYKNILFNGRLSDDYKACLINRLIKHFIDKLMNCKEELFQEYEHTILLLLKVFTEDESLFLIQLIQYLVNQNSTFSEYYSRQKSIITKISYYFCYMLVWEELCTDSIKELIKKAINYKPIPARACLSDFIQMKSINIWDTYSKKEHIPFGIYMGISINRISWESRVDEYSNRIIEYYVIFSVLFIDISLYSMSKDTLYKWEDLYERDLYKAIDCFEDDGNLCPDTKEDCETISQLFGTKRIIPNNATILFNQLHKAITQTQD